VSASPVRTDPLLHVVVVAYGDPTALRSSLERLGGAYAVVVVDNSSDPETAAVAAALGARYVDPGDNLGFAAGVNRALSELPIPSVDVLLLNPDASLDAAAVERLRDVLAEEPDVACVAPAQRRPGSDAAAPVQWPFPTPLRAWAEALGLGRFLRGWGFVSASVLLVRGAALADVGSFDEGFFLYAEEADWERRAVQGAWRVSFCEDAVALHAGEGTDPDPKRREQRFHAGVERYVRKWHGAGGWNAYRWATVLTAIRRAVVAGGERRRSSWRLARLYAQGPYRVARRAGAVPERRHNVRSLANAGPAR